MLTISVYTYFSFQLKVQLKLKRNAPCGMIRGSAAPHYNVIYVTPRGTTSIYRYHLSEDKWKMLTASPFQDSGLLVRDNALIAIGGIDLSSDHAVNKVLTLRGRKWREDLPPMNSRRSSPAVATYSTYSFVIGGNGSWIGNISATAEMLDQHDRWTVLGQLPCPHGLLSATVCGSELYVISGYSESKGYSCSLRHIIASNHPTTSPPALTWTPIPQTPVYRSTSICLANKLLLVGGTDRNTHDASSKLYLLSQGEWVETGSLFQHGYYYLVACPSEKTMVVVGGKCGTSSSDRVELCSVV